MGYGKLTVDDLLTLEDYARRRSAIRRHAMAEKNLRRLEIGDSVHLYFENRTTMHYQVQEVLRAEKIFEPDGIEQELAAYNPLIPDGDNFKATMMLQYADVSVRRRELARLIDIESHVWMRVADAPPVYAHADEDMDRSNDEKTSAVHFLRFALDAHKCAAIKDGASVAVGIDHEHYHASVDPLPPALLESLRGDLR